MCILLFVKYKFYFMNIFVNLLTFANKRDIIKTVQKGGEQVGKQNLLLCESFQQGTES